MHWYAIRQNLVPLNEEPTDAEPCVLLLTSEELTRYGASNLLFRHTPTPAEARVCKAEVHPDFLSGTLRLPAPDDGGSRLTCGYLITVNRIIFTDDDTHIFFLLKRMVREKRATDGGVGRFLYEFFELLLSRDLYRLEEIEDRLQHLEEQVMNHELDAFSLPMSELRQEIMARFRYYSQLDDVAYTLRANENGFFTDKEELSFRMLENRVVRLREEAQFLREYGSQLQSLFQSEIDIRQNRVMQILTIVTTIFLPLSLLAGWYGMNFTGMPELSWKYGYPLIILVSLLVVGLSLWICKRKKFW